MLPMPVTDAPLHALLYRSMAMRACSAADLDRITSAAATRNEANDVTGLLLYGNMELLPTLPGQFVQWLEGSEDAVAETFARIRRDRRHTDVQLLARGPMRTLTRSNARVFPVWSMAVRRLAGLPATLEGFLEHAYTLPRSLAA